MLQMTPQAALTCHSYHFLQCPCRQLDALAFEVGCETPLGSLVLRGATRQSERGDTPDFKECHGVLNQLDMGIFERRLRSVMPVCCKCDWCMVGNVTARSQ
jgi:hypothetical protein